VELPEIIELVHRAPPLRFLVIGGYAVAAHGYARVTFDADLLVNRTDREAWFGRPTNQGFRILQQLFLKYGNREIYESFLRLLRNP
jgi:hypothetical protein